MKNDEAIMKKIADFKFNAMVKIFMVRHYMLYLSSFRL